MKIQNMYLRKKMKKSILLRSSLLMVFITLASCSSDDTTDLFGNWIERSVFDGTARSNASATTVGNIGYIGTGYDGDDYLKDFWAYDMDGNFWFQLADFQGAARSSAVAFTIDDKVYMGTGYDGDNELADFYAYDITANTWSEIAPFEGTPRRGAVAFNSSTAGYLGTGFDGDNDKKDFWKYDPATDAWDELVGFGGSKRRDAATFTINDQVYLGTGISNGILEADFWVFDLNTESWNSLLDLDDDDDYNIIRSNAVGFTIGDKGYFACGTSLAGVTDTVWEYNPSTDLWEEKTAFEGFTREGAVAFSNPSQIRALVALGRSGSLYLDDNREFFPNEEEDEDD